MAVAPVMSKRAEPLGWLAATPPDYPYRFAVVGTTEAEALANFEQAVDRWESIPDVPHSNRSGRAPSG